MTVATSKKLAKFDLKGNVSKENGAHKETQELRKKNKPGS
jgi:hypothetical protein